MKVKCCTHRRSIKNDDTCLFLYLSIWNPLYVQETYTEVAKINLKKQVENNHNELRKLSWMKTFFTWLRGVMHTIDLDSAVSCTPKILTLRCHAHYRVLCTQLSQMKALFTWLSGVMHTTDFHSWVSCTVYTTEFDFWVSCTLQSLKPQCFVHSRFWLHSVMHTTKFDPWVSCTLGVRLFLWE